MSNSQAIDDHIRKSSKSISASKPKVDPKKRRALIPENDFNVITSLQAKYSVGMRYVLRTDISRFYGTIYTHSIPWAIHGKPLAKLKQKPTQLFGNRIDQRVRNTMGAQTIGIPIGPDTSLLVAEIVGAAVDTELRKRVGPLHGFRYIDDYYLYFTDSVLAESALGALHNAVASFELELNPNKTYIKALPQSLEPDWKSDIRLIRFSGGYRSQTAQLISFFSRTFEHVNNNPDDLVLKYAVARSKTLLFSKSVWDLYHSLLMQAMTSEPSVIPDVIPVLVAYRNLGFPHYSSRLRATITELIRYHIKYEHSYELAWALWMCKEFSIKIGIRDANRIAQIVDPVVALITLDLQANGLIPANMNVSKWMSLMTAAELYTENWLLAYEANKQGWLPNASGKDFVTADPFFGPLKNADVFFYDAGTKNPSIHLSKPSQGRPPSTQGSNQGSSSSYFR